MHSHGKMIRDAWVFDIFPETEDCSGWSSQRLDELYDKVTKAWEPYGNLPSLLPPELREKHMRIFRKRWSSPKQWVGMRMTHSVTTNETNMKTMF